MKILVDADACPVKKIIVRLAKEKKLPVIMLIDTSHVLNDGYSTVITVDKGRDSADIRLVNLIEPGDVVVTQDFGVAAMALARGAHALNQNGMEYNNGNMDRLLFERALGQEIRRAGGRTGHIRKRTKADDAAFEASFRRILEERE
ncbi:MAG: YaiI/YqxD family protein [Ruminococcaceae bacterium]|nr:YaiI/YqxD family protein [Oscillospiraceae bacterium]